MKHRARCAIFFRARHAAARVAPEGVPGRLEYERAAGERPPRARPQRRGSPGPIPNPAVKPAFAESTAAQGCGRAGRRARGGRFSMRARAPGAARAACAGRGPQGRLPLRASLASWGGSGVAGGPIGVAAHTAPPGIVGRAGTAGGSPAGLSASWGIVRRGGLIGVARRAGAFFIFMRPRRGSRVRAECPQGDRPLQVFLYSEAFRCRRICARPSCWIGPAHGMRRRICVGPPCGHSSVNVV